MSMMQSSNPVLASAFGSHDQGTWGAHADRSGLMTLQGAINATAIVLGVSISMAIVVWTFVPTMAGWALPAVTIGGSLLGFVLVMICGWKPTVAPFLAMPVAVCEGCLAGGASLMWSAYAASHAGASGKLGLLASAGSGLVIQASLLTTGIAGGMLILYSMRVIRATEKLRMGLAAAMVGILFVSLGSMLLRLVGVSVPYIWENGLIGIGFAGFVVVIAALNLVLDFGRVEEGVADGRPKYMEWMGAIGILVTLVWLYISMLRLLALLSSRRN